MKHRIPVSIAAAVAAALALSGCTTAQGSDSLAAGDPDAPLTEVVSVTFGSFNTGTASIPILIALEEGYFEEENLKVTLDGQQSAATTAQLVATGDNQLGYISYQSALPALANGVEMHALRTVQELALGSQLLWGLKGAYDDLEAFAEKGGVIAVPSVGGFNELAIRAALAEEGLSEAKVDFLAVAPGDMVGALERGDVQGAALTPPTAAGEWAKGDASKLSVIDDQVDHDATRGLPQGGLWVNSGWAAENPQVLAAFLRAVDKASEAMTEDVWRSYMAEFSKLPEHIVQEMTYEPWVGAVDAKNVGRVIALMEQFGQIDAGSVTPEKVIG